MIVLSEQQRERSCYPPGCCQLDTSSHHEDKHHFLHLPRGWLPGLGPVLPGLSGDQGDQHGGEDGEDGGGVGGQGREDCCSGGSH